MAGVVMNGKILTNRQREKIAHAIGDSSALGCSTSGGRNYYCGSADDPDWLDLVTRELAVLQRSKLVHPSVYFFVTKQGRAALAHDLELL